MRNPALFCSVLLLSAPLAHAEALLQTPIVISLADTAAQKAKLQTVKIAPATELPISANSSAKPAESKGFFKRLFSRSETDSAASVESTETASDWRSKQEQRAQARDRKKVPRYFDDHFKKYSKHYFGIGTDWRWFQAQAMVESEMKPAVRSNSGAMGLMQIMPKTFQEIRSRNPHLKDPFDPHFSIAAGIYYNRQLYDAWSSIDNEDDRRRFMFASYNAGLGNVKRAAKRAGNPVNYSALEPALSAGPRHYLVKIERERKKLSN